MKLVQFGDIALPSTQSKFDMPRSAVHQTLSPTGSRGGSYDLYGVQSPINDQALGYEFVFRGGERSVLDDVLGKIGRRDTLIAALYDGTRRQANAKLLSVSESTLTREETSLGLRKVKCDWTAEPYWYDDTATQVDLVATTQALVVNDGNARAIRGLKFTLNPTRWRFPQRRFPQRRFLIWHYAPAHRRILVRCHLDHRRSDRHADQPGRNQFAGQHDARNL